MRISRKLVGVGVLALMTGCSTINSLNPFASKPKGDQPAKLVELKGSIAVRTAWKLDIGAFSSLRGAGWSPFGFEKGLSELRLSDESCGMLEQPVIRASTPTPTSLLLIRIFFNLVSGL